MNTQIKKIFYPGNAQFWLPVALLGRSAVVMLLLLNLGELHFGQAVTGLCPGDCLYYRITAQNVIEKSVYALYNDADGNPIPYAGRMPGYEAMLWLLARVMDFGQAWHAVLFLQVLLGAVSAYCLARLAWEFTKSYSLFILTFAAYLISTYTTIFDLQWLTESFAISAAIIGFFLLCCGKGRASLFIAGCLLAWAIFLRQLAAPMLLLAGVYLVVTAVRNKSGYANLAKTLFCFYLPFALADGAWIIRNYVQKKEFIPLVDGVHAGYRYSDRFVALMEFVQSWGGDLVYWNPGAEITFFIRNEATASVSRAYPDISSLPGYIYTSRYNADSLRKVQQYYQLAEMGSGSVAVRQQADQWVTAALRRYTESFKAEKPLHYRVLAPLRLLPRFVLHPGTYNIANVPFAAQSRWQQLFKLFYTAHYLLVLFLGLAGCAIVLLGKPIPAGLKIIAINVLYVLLVCPLVLRRIEYRYFVLAYPFAVLLACYAGHCIWHQLRHKITPAGKPARTNQNVFQ